MSADLSFFYVPLADTIVRLGSLTEAHREPLRAAGAADADIWDIHPSSLLGERFDASFDACRATAGGRSSRCWRRVDWSGMFGLLRAGNVRAAHDVDKMPLFAWLAPLYQHGNLAVQIFWIISGFVFAAVYYGRRSTTRSFMINRSPGFILFTF